MDATPYERLAAMIEAECELAAARDFAALADAKRHREQIVATLPPTPPAAARAALERCVRAQARLAVELSSARETLLGDLRRLRSAERAAAGYRPAAGSRAPAVRASA